MILSPSVPFQLSVGEDVPVYTILQNKGMKWCGAAPYLPFLNETSKPNKLLLS